MSFYLQFTPEAEETYDSLISQLQQRWGANFVHKLENKESVKMPSNHCRIALHISPLI